MTPCAPATPLDDFEETRLLDGRVICYQPRKGYRSAIDPVLMQAAVQAAPGDRVLDLGCGAGAAALSLAARVPGVIVDGLDLQPILIAAAAAGAVASGLADRAAFFEGDMLDLPDPVRTGGYDHVIANPPFERAGTVRPSPDPVKAAATVEGQAKLVDWIASAMALVRPGGTVTFIHRGDRLEELAASLAAAGTVAILPLLARDGDPAPVRGIVKARAGAAGGVTRIAPLVLHETIGNYTSRADRLLRGGELDDFHAAPGAT
ncbi:MAG: methyltransferase [Rhodospirillaceae bacterium]